MRVEVIAVSMLVPPAVLAAVWLTIVIAAPRHPFIGIEPHNAAEAAAFRDGAALVRRIHAGEDPNGPATVRGGIFGREPVVLTPLEAAAAQDRPEVIELLMDLGARPDAHVWTRAWCISDEPDVRSMLDRYRPVDAHAECDTSGQ